MDSSVDEALFMTQNSTKTDISAEGNGLEHLVIFASGVNLNLPKSGISIFFVK